MRYSPGMSRHRNETKSARYLQNIFEVPYQTALRTARTLHDDVYGYAKSSGESYLNVLERMAGKVLTRDR